MTAREAIETVLDRGRSLRTAGDVDALVDHFTDDASFRVIGFGVPAEGKAAIRAVLGALIDEYQFLEYRPIETVIDGDRVAIRHVLKVRHTATGKTIETETADFITMKDGKMASYTQYVDTRFVATLSEA